MRYACAVELSGVLAIYRGERRNALASIFLLLSLMTPAALKKATAQEAKENKGAGSISGRVTIQGRPAPGIDLELLPSRGYLNDKAIAGARTDDEGRFIFAGVPASHYWIKVNSREYVTPDERRWEGSGRSVSVASGASLTNVDLDLVMGGVIAGRITDIDGNPVAGEWARLVCQSGYGPARDAFSGDEFKTNTNGEYRIHGLPPGRYIVGIGVDVARLTGAVMDKNDPFGARGRVGARRYFEQVFYPGMPDPKQAQPLEISPAVEVKEINFTVGRPLHSFTASGRVIDAETGEPLRGKHRLQVSHRVSGGYVGTMADDQVNEDGSFEITGLLSERFFASVELNGGSDLYSDKVEFEIKGEDISGLEIKVRHGFSMTGSVVIEGDAPAEALAKRGQLKLTIMSPLRGGEYASMHREITVNADGTFKMIGLPRGPVEIAANAGATSRFFTMVRVEYPKAGAAGETQLAEDGWTKDYRLIEVGRNIQGARVVVRYKGGSILCHVNVVGTLPHGVQLMVLVDTGIGKGGWSGWGEVDADGDILVAGLEPGSVSLEVGDGGRRFSEMKRVTVTKNQQTKVSFTIDASKLERREY